MSPVPLASTSSQRAERTPQAKFAFTPNQGAYVTLALVVGLGLMMLLVETLIYTSTASAHSAQLRGASGMMSGPASSSIHLTIFPQMSHSSIPSIHGPAYSQTSLTVPAHSLVTVTIVNDDPGNTALPAGSPFGAVAGVVGGVASVDGQAYSRLDVSKVAHTFTVPQLGINVPIPGDAPAGHRGITVTFSFRTGANGMYMWRCMDPCGSGVSGWSGPMATMGYMQGMIMIG